MFGTKKIRRLSITALSTLLSTTFLLASTLPSYAEGASTTAPAASQATVAIAIGHAVGIIVHPPAAPHLVPSPPAPPAGRGASSGPSMTAPASGSAIWRVQSAPTSDTEDHVVELARDDLASRLGVSPDEIEVVKVTSVNWPDSSLGNPQPGLLYSQTVTPGYDILLQVGDQTYVYHSNTRDTVVYCGTA